MSTDAIKTGTMKKRKNGGAESENKKKKVVKKTPEERLVEMREKYAVDIEKFVVYAEHGRPKIGMLRVDKNGNVMHPNGPFNKDTVDLAEVYVPPMLVLPKAKLSGEGNLMESRADPNHEPARTKARYSYGVRRGWISSKEMPDGIDEIQERFVEDMKKLSVRLLQLMFDEEIESLKPGQDSARNMARYSLLAELKCSNVEQLKSKERKEKAVKDRVEKEARNLFVSACKASLFHLTHEKKEAGKSEALWCTKRVWKGEQKYTGVQMKEPDGPSKELLPSSLANWSKIEKKMKALKYTHKPIEYTNSVVKKTSTGKETMQIEPNKVKIAGEIVPNPFFNPVCEFTNGTSANTVVTSKILISAKTGSKESPNGYGIIAFISSPIQICEREESGNEQEEVLFECGGYEEENNEQVIDVDVTKADADANGDEVKVDEDGDEEGADEKVEEEEEVEKEEDVEVEDENESGAEDSGVSE